MSVMEVLPKDLYPLFWDINPETLDVQKYPKFVVERIIDIGDEAATSWMRKTYPKEKIVEIIKSSRKLSEKTANFWATIYGIDRKEVKSLTKYNKFSF